MRSYTWSGLTGPDAPEPGVSPGNIDIYSAGNVSTRPFDSGFLKVDTDVALEVAEANGGAALRKKSPEVRNIYALQWEDAKARLIWRVVYGESLYRYKLIVDVNASTGEFVRTEK